MRIEEFVLARIAEWETEARQAIDERARTRFVRPETATEPDYSLQAWPDSSVPAVLVGPELVLRECEAYRRIAAAFEDERQRMDIYNRDFPLGLLTTEGDLRARQSSNARWAGLEIAMRALASIWSDHPDFDTAWRA